MKTYKNIAAGSLLLTLFTLTACTNTSSDSASRLDQVHMAPDYLYFDPIELSIPQNYITEIRNRSKWSLTRTWRAVFSQKQSASELFEKRSDGSFRYMANGVAAVGGSYIARSGYREFVGIECSVQVVPSSTDLRTQGEPIKHEPQSLECGVDDDRAFDPTTDLDSVDLTINIGVALEGRVSASGVQASVSLMSLDDWEAAASGRALNGTIRSDVYGINDKLIPPADQTPLSEEAVKSIRDQINCNRLRIRQESEITPYILSIKVDSNPLQIEDDAIKRVVRRSRAKLGDILGEKLINSTQIADETLAVPDTCN